MTDVPGTGKWIDGLYSDTPSVVAARWVLKRRLRGVDRLLALADENAGENKEYVHQLRVASRRSAAALTVFRDFCDRRHRKRIGEALKRIRKAAAAARRDDVHCAILEADARSAPEYGLAGYTVVLDEMARQRAEAWKALHDAAVEHRRLSRSARISRLLQTAPLESPWYDEELIDDRHDNVPYTLGQLAGVVLPNIWGPIASLGERELKSPDQLHELRIRGKKLRYAVELFTSCFSNRLRDDLYTRWVALLERLGEINDYVEIVERVNGIALVASDMNTTDSLDAVSQDSEEGNSIATTPVQRGLGGEFDLSILVERYSRERDRRFERFFVWWKSDDRRLLFSDWNDLILTSREHELASIREPSPRPENTEHPSMANSDSLASGVEHDIVPHRRVAAIDVGTNSIRLVVGQSDPVQRFRIIQDYKETTRLGSGVYHDGNIREETIVSSVKAIERMKAMAEACHVEKVRAIGTSALREARNSEEFTERVRQATGVNIEVIDADTEARLSFSSVASSFELDDRRVAIVDIGGGSTEIVLSSGGVIEAIESLPIGALRLSEAFSRHGEIAQDWFEDMCATVDKAIENRMRHASRSPYMIIGAGGTFTSLARVAIRHDGSPSAEAMCLPTAVRGYEMRRSEISFFLNLLRKMPLEERRRVPGLNTQRAETIVAGVCIIDRLARFLGVARVRVHDGGIRNGLLLEMLGDVAPPYRPHDTDWILAIRRFAERCRYDKKHSEHVANLAVSIFDQLAAQEPGSREVWATEEAREYLFAGAVVHDVGLSLDARGHHKHGYDMLIHAKLPELTRREVEIIANLARYHRRRGPSDKDPNLRRLCDDDQRLVARLAGILRIADGLDRSRDQAVCGVEVNRSGGEVRMIVSAASKPLKGLRGAKRKADVFEKVFRVRVRLDWEAMSPEVEVPSTDILVGATLETAEVSAS